MWLGAYFLLFIAPVLLTVILGLSCDAAKAAKATKSGRLLIRFLSEGWVLHHKTTFLQLVC